MKLTFTLLTAFAALALNGMAADEKKADAPAAGGDKGAKATPEEAFKKIDTNSDSSISLDEWKATKQSQKDLVKAEAAFKRKDKDADSKLTLEEFKAHAPKKDGEKGAGDKKGDKKADAPAAK